MTTRDFILFNTLQNRKVFKKLMDRVSLEQINMVPSGFNNNIIWNCAHILSIQQMLIYGLAGLPFTIENEQVMHFNIGTKPEKFYDSTFAEKVKGQLFETMEVLDADLKQYDFEFKYPFTTITKVEISNIDHAISFVNYHEGIHLGAVLSLLKFV